MEPRHWFVHAVGVRVGVGGDGADSNDEQQLSLLDFVVFSNNDTCVFGPLGTYPTFENVSTTASSTTMTTVLAPGTWNIMIRSNSTSQSVLQFRWSAVGESMLPSNDDGDDGDDGFWTTEHIIIVSVVGAILVVAVVSVIAGAVWYVRHRRGGYESV